MCSNTFCWISPFGADPTAVMTGWPFRNSIRVGSDMTPHLAAVSGLASIFTLPITNVEALSTDRSSSTGARALQGPHQGAQKSTSNGNSAASSTSSKLWSVSSITVIRVFILKLSLVAAVPVLMSPKRADTCHGLADRQLMHLGGAFICQYRFEIVGVAQDWVLGGDSTGS